MAEYGDLRGPLDKMIQMLKAIERHTRCTSCGGNGGSIGDAAITTAGTGDVPAGLRSFSIVKTSPNTDTVTITLSDGSTYVMVEPGEVFVDAATPGGLLPDYTIAGPGVWKWHGIK